SQAEDRVEADPDSCIAGERKQDDRSNQGIVRTSEPRRRGTEVRSQQRCSEQSRRKAVAQSYGATVGREHHHASRATSDLIFEIMCWWPVLFSAVRVCVPARMDCGYRGSPGTSGSGPVVEV